MLENIDPLRGSKDELVLKLVEFYDQITRSPYYDGYVTVLVTIKRWNAEITNNPMLIGDEDKGFDKTHKYLTEIESYYKQLDYLRNQMNPIETAMANEEVTSLFEKAHSEIKKENAILQKHNSGKHS